ncbi:MAG: ribosome-recycling factor [Candidatus Magasanikbacteria bacterium]
MSTDIIENFQKEGEKRIEKFRNELKGVRTNRPSTSLVEDIKVEYHGSSTPIEHVSSISISPPREITIRVWEEDMVKDVAKAIEKSDLNLSPNIDDQNVIRIFLPELSQERREELINHIDKKAEEYRIKIRKLREKFKNQVEERFENSEIDEDKKYRLEDEIQEQTDNFNEEIKDISESKKTQIREN